MSLRSLRIELSDEIDESHSIGSTTFRKPTGFHLDNHCESRRILCDEEERSTRSNRCTSSFGSARYSTTNGHWSRRERESRLFARSLGECYFDGKIAVESHGVAIASQLISFAKSSIDTIVQILHLIFEKLNFRGQEKILSTHLAHFRILIHHAIQREQVSQSVRASDRQRAAQCKEMFNG